MMDRKFSDIAERPVIEREINALAIFIEMLNGLNAGERKRILEYLSDRFSEPLEEGK